MMQATDIAKLERRAHKAMVRMSEVCVKAGKHRQVWYRARKRGTMDYELYRALLSSLAQIEQQAANQSFHDDGTPTDAEIARACA